MTQKNNENTKFLLVDDSSSNYLPLMIVGAGLAYTFYHKYTKHCSLDGKTAIFSSQWIESIDPNVPGKINLDVKQLNLDALSLSSHKIYGPKGIGGLYIKKGTPFCPLIRGGHQENGRRAGTENTLGIIGLGKAIEAIILNIIFDEILVYIIYL